MITVFEPVRFCTLLFSMSLLIQPASTMAESKLPVENAVLTAAPQVPPSNHT